MTLPRGIVKKVFAKFSTSRHTARIMAKVPKMAAMLGTAAWMRGWDTTLFNS